jgi:predicted ATPase
MIRKVSIRNFKSLRDVRVELERFTVFVGPNASGKTSLLQALDLLCRAFQEPEFHLSVVQSLSRGSREPVELTAESGGRCFRYSAADKVSARAESQAPDSAEWRLWRHGVAAPPLPLSVLLRLEVSKLVAPGVASPDPTVMDPDGTGMHAALASMALNDPDSWQALQEHLRLIVPTIKRLRHTKAIPGQTPSLLFDTHGAAELPSSQVSEGTLLVLGLLTALYGPDRPSLILLDDLDRALHPVAQKNLVTLLRGLLETNPDLQIVATTHSPYLLDCMEPNEVRMTYLQDGSTVCAPLEEHPEFETWKEEMAPGEMWSLFGEKWLTKKKEAVA